VKVCSKLIKFTTAQFTRVLDLFLLSIQPNEVGISTVDVEIRMGGPSFTIFQ
jgi:hypothetical protein